jgi:hypothetical protein
MVAGSLRPLTLSWVVLERKRKGQRKPLTAHWAGFHYDGTLMADIGEHPNTIWRGRCELSGDFLLRNVSFAEGRMEYRSEATSVVGFI